MEWAYARPLEEIRLGRLGKLRPPFLRWANDPATHRPRHQHELHFQPEILEGYDAVAFVGHDEYWSREMRDAVDSYVDAAARLRGSPEIMWQTRIGDGGTTQVATSTATATTRFRDGPQQQLTTTAWESASRAAGATTFGVNALRGMYVGWGGARRAMPAVFRSPAAPLGVAGTDLYYGDVFGAASRIFGYEVDGLAYAFATACHIRPAVMPTRRHQIIAMGVAALAEENHGERGDNHFLGEDDVVFAAEAVFGAATPEQRRLRYGSGMMVSFSKAAARYSPPAPANGSPA